MVININSTSGVSPPDAIQAQKPTVVKSAGPPEPPGPVPASAENAAGLDALDASSPGGVLSSRALLASVSTMKADLPSYFGASSKLVLDQRGDACVALHGTGNPVIYRLGSGKANGLIARHLRNASKPFTKKAVADITEALRGEAELLNERVTVWHRVAQRADGTVVIALYDEANTQVWIRTGMVEIVATGSDTLFVVGANSKAMPLPVKGGNRNLLSKYVNLDPYEMVVFVGYVTYGMAHAKKDGNVFPILALIAGQGCGKGVICKCAIALIDANTVGVQRMPANVADLAVAAEAHHVVVFDNLRQISASMSDALCMLATGGSITSRKLYTNGESSVLSLLCSVIVNGIHAFLQEPDLVQRSVKLHPKPIPEGERQSELEMWKSFEADLPQILGELYELIAQILVHLPNVEVTHPQRMLDFVKWLAAMEMVHGAPVGAYQAVYSEMVDTGQLDSIRDDLLGNAVLDFAQTLGAEGWTGTPQELLTALTKSLSAINSRTPRGWPDTAISLSKRLAALQAALATQGVAVVFTRGKTRQISIQFKGQGHD